ncbi:hypothetical protein D3C85_1467780 [compost metagenome]
MLVWLSPSVVMALVATSHGDVNLLVPSRLNCTEQSAGFVATTIGDFSWACCSAGLAKCVRPWKMGMVSTAART